MFHHFLLNQWLFFFFFVPFAGQMCRLMTDLHSHFVAMETAALTRHINNNNNNNNNNDNKKYKMQVCVDIKTSAR